MPRAILLYLKGLAMGAADVVPGVSGGTIAFISGIYDDLIGSLRDLGDFAHLAIRKIIGRNDRPWGELLVLLRLSFFVPLGLGILGAFAIGSRIIPPLIEHHPAPIFSFFVGLIAVSAVFVFREIPHHDRACIAAMVGGLIVGVALGWNAPPPAEAAEVSTGTVFGLGMIAICAMLLPGISGSYILLLLGKYSWILERLHERDLRVIATFAVGAGVGLLLFSRVLGWLLRRYHATTFSALLGILVGALVHPGRLAVDSLSRENAPLCIGLLVAGMAIVLVLERWAGKARRKLASSTS